jgi:hypothetical protein
MTDAKHMFYLICGIPRNDDWKFFLLLMMDKNVTATLTCNEIVTKLIKKESTISSKKGLNRNALLFAHIGKGRRRGKGDKDKSDKKK